MKKKERNVSNGVLEHSVPYRTRESLKGLVIELARIFFLETEPVALWAAS